MVIDYLFIAGFILSLISLIYVIGLQIIKKDINTSKLRLIISILIIFLTLINTYYVYKGIFIGTNSLAVSILASFILQTTIALSFVQLPSLKTKINILHMTVIIMLSLLLSLLSVYNYSYSKRVAYKEIDKKVLESSYTDLLKRLNNIKNMSNSLFLRKENLKKEMRDEEAGTGENKRAGRGEIWRQLNLMYQKVNIEYKEVNNYYNKLAYDNKRLKKMLKNNSNPYEVYILALKINGQLKESDKSLSVNNLNIKSPVTNLFEGNVGYDIILFTIKHWLFTLIATILGIFLFFMYREKHT